MTKQKLEQSSKLALQRHCYLLVRGDLVSSALFHTTLLSSDSFQLYRGAQGFVTSDPREYLTWTLYRPPAQDISWTSLVVRSMFKGSVGLQGCLDLGDRVPVFTALSGTASIMKHRPPIAAPGQWDLGVIHYQ